MARRVMSALRRAVALDMDGTTLNNCHKLTSRTIDIIRKVDAIGATVIISTGRPAPALKPFIEELNLPRPLPVVCFNGACALLSDASGQDQQVLITEGLDASTATRVLSVCAELGLCASYSLPSHAAVAPQTEAHEAQLHLFENLEGVKQNRVDDLTRLVSAGDLPLKIVAFADDPDVAAEKARSLLPSNVVNIIAAEMHIEFLKPGTSKGGTLERLCCEKLGIKMDEVIAFGDNHNDQEMLRLSGEGVAMRNAKDSLKEIADRTSEWTNDEDGVALELSALLESGLLRPP